MSESFKSVCRSCYMVRDIPGDPFLGEQVCTPCLERYAPKVTIPRDLYELYEEAAEKWAREQIDIDVTVHPGTQFCRSCDRGGTSEAAAVTHAADCKAARILNLKMEGAT